MIDVITSEYYNQYSKTLDSMHQLRHRVFQERMGWDVNSENGREYDQFDDVNPIYMVHRNEAGEVDGTWRLLPTDGPNMLADVFPHLLDGEEAPKDPQVWETSRFAVEAMVGDTDNLATVSKVTAELFTALAEYGLANGWTGVVAVFDIRIRRLLARIGWEPVKVSRRKRIGNTITVAGHFELNEGVLQRLYEKNSLVGPVAHVPAALVTHTQAAE